MDESATVQVLKDILSELRQMHYILRAMDHGSGQATSDGATWGVPSSGEGALERIRRENRDRLPSDPKVQEDALRKIRGQSRGPGPSASSGGKMISSIKS